MRQGMLTPEYGASTMKISAERFIDRLMMTTHLRAVVWLFCIFFCIAVWGVCIHYSLKMIELLLTVFKGA
jgi:hypothetical protein